MIKTSRMQKQENETWGLPRFARLYVSENTENTTKKRLSSAKALCIKWTSEHERFRIKVKAPIAGQSYEFFSKLEIYESIIAILVYRIQTSKCTL